MINYFGLTSQSFSTTLHNHLLKAKNKTKCLSQDLAYIVCKQVYDIKIISSTKLVLMILNEIQKLHLLQSL